MYFLTVLEADSLSSGFWAKVSSDEGLLLGFPQSKGQLLAVSWHGLFSLHAHGPTLMTSSNPNYLPKAHLKILSITLGVKASAYKLGEGDTNILSRTIYKTLCNASKDTTGLDRIPKIHVPSWTLEYYLIWKWGHKGVISWGPTRTGWMNLNPI